MQHSYTFVRASIRTTLVIVGSLALTLSALAAVSSLSGQALATVKAQRGVTQAQVLPSTFRPALYRLVARNRDAAYDVRVDGCATLTETKLTACFWKGGVHFSGAESLALHLVSYGRGEALLPVKPVRPETNGNRVSYDHGTLTEWWRVLPMGFEQGFTVTKRPKGQGNLTLVLTTNTKANQNDGTLDWGRLHYGKLVATDANGRAVPTSLTSEDNRILISVNDANAAYPITVDPLVWLEQKVVADDGEAGDNFGWKVAVSGDTAIVGVYHDRINGVFFQGSAYVYAKTNGVWKLVQKLTSSDGAQADRFGGSVAVSGSVIAVGASSKTINGNNGQGAVYVFTRSSDGTWVQSDELLASDGAALDGFGVAVAVADDGSILVGSYQADIKANASQGAVYVFTRSGNSWNETQKLVARDGAAGDFFGNSAAVSGTTAVIGADQEGSLGPGVAYVFENSKGAWSQVGKLSVSDGSPLDIFGYSVAISGATIVVGAPFADINGNRDQGAAYVFSNSSGAWAQVQKLVDANATGGGGKGKAISYPRKGKRKPPENFGWSVAVSGSTILIGPYFTESAFLFTGSNGTWTQAQELKASDGVPGDTFGPAVALSGTTALISAMNATINGNVKQGAAYFFGRSNLDLALSVPIHVNPGSEFTSQVLATNSSSVASPAVAVTVAVPAAASFVSANATQGACSEASGMVSCDFGPIAGNAGMATANIQLKATGNEGDVIVNTASVSKASPPLVASASVAIMVNTPPVASDGTLTTNENTTANGTLVATDPDGDALVFSISQPPAHGTLILGNATTGAYAYTPNGGYSGPDLFTFKVNDGQDDSNTATVSITVNEVTPPNNAGGGGGFGLFAILGLAGLLALSIGDITVRQRKGRGSEKGVF